MATKKLALCGRDHSKLDVLQNFKDEDVMSWFTVGAKFYQKKCHGDCEKDAKPSKFGKAWYCRGFNVCDCIFCPNCYCNRLSAAATKEAATHAKEDTGEAKTRKSSRVRTTGTKYKLADSVEGQLW